MEIIKEFERVDDLGVGGLRIIQNPSAFCFGIDAVLLSDFVKVQKNENYVMDLGTGTGIVPILLSHKSRASKIVGIEIQSDMVDMANRSIVLNGLQERVEVLHQDIKDLIKDFALGSVDVITSNPPYMNDMGGLKNPTDSKAIARHEVLCSLEDIIKNSYGLLRDKGRLIMIHRPHRLVDIMSMMRKYRIEPKRMRLVYPKLSKEPNMVLIEGVKHGNPFLRVDSPLVVYQEDGNYTEDIYQIYNKNSKGEA